MQNLKAIFQKIKQSQFVKEQIIPVLLTALISSLITILQSYLSGYAQVHGITETASVASALGAILKTTHQALTN